MYLKVESFRCDVLFGQRVAQIVKLIKVSESVISSLPRNELSTDKKSLLTWELIPLRDGTVGLRQAQHLIKSTHAPCIRQ